MLFVLFCVVGNFKFGNIYACWSGVYDIVKEAGKAMMIWIQVGKWN